MKFEAPHIQKILSLIDTQAEDDGLWFVAKTAPEAYLQQELRRLTRTVEDVLRGTPVRINEDNTHGMTVCTGNEDKIREAK